VEPIRLERVSPAIVRLVVSGAGAVPGQSVNSYVVGRRDLIVVDPGDPSDAAADALLAVAGEGSAAITGIVLTSAAPDHAAGAEALAGRLGIPIFGGPGIARDLAFEVTELADGDRVPTGDVELVVITTPGPRPDAISLVAAEESAVFAGDLVGVPPSRSILPPPDAGEMAASRRRVAELAAELVLAAHGDVSAPR
jgi:glyoxylase-like metal-dependent hydrolase (beta-lactamase superfamily II)